MKQLWILNSSLLVIFAATFLINFLLQQSPPPLRKRKPFVATREIDTKLAVEGIENIYKYDLFGTFRKAEFRPSTKQLINPIPQPKTVAIKPPPDLKKPTFIEPLNIQLKGIAYSYDEEKSISMITDETKKEDIYHVGDILKDAQIIRIAKDRVTLLRPNGQHETIYLRKPDDIDDQKQTWSDVVKKIKENTFEVDFKKIAKAIPTLGTLSEKLALLTMYRKGKPTGLKITNIDPLGTALGLKKNDLITAINDVSTADKKDRIKIYDNITKLKKGDTINVSIERGKTPVKVSYKLTDLLAIRKREFIPDEQKVQKKKDTLFKLSKLQEREKKRREFAKKHDVKQGDAVAEIRRRLLENIRSYSRSNRVR
jgi:type II secretion system protein C